MLMHLKLQEITKSVLDQKAVNILTILGIDPESLQFIKGYFGRKTAKLKQIL
jgi:hypothetical protein